MNKQLLITILLCLTIILPVQAANTFRIQPNATATSASYWYLEQIRNMSVYWNAADGKLNLLQDWNATLMYNGIVNVTMPRTLASYTFDYDTYNYVAERSLSGKKYNGTRTNMFSNGIVLYYPFEDFSTTAWDWSPIWKKVFYTTQEYATKNSSVATPSYPLSYYKNATDGNWSSYANMYLVSDNYWYINYTIPSNSYGAQWKIRYRPEHITGNTINKTFYMNTTNNCYNKTFGKIAFRANFRLTGAAPDVSITLSCLNHKYTWTDIYYQAETATPLRFYEEQILWMNRTNARYNGTNTGTSAVAGKIGMGLGFTNTGQYSTIGQDITLQTSFGIAVWLKDIDTAGSTSFIIGNSAYSAYDRIGYFTGTSLRLESMTDNDYCTTTDTRDGLWHHYVFNVNAGTCAFYKDGVAMTMTDNTLSNPQLVLNRVGASGSSNVWNGTIDELYLYNRSLTTTEIARLSSVSCHSGSCYNFDGKDDYITSAATTLGTGNITYGLWFNSPTTLTKQADYASLLEKRGTGGAGLYDFLLQTTTGEALMCAFKNSTSTEMTVSTTGFTPTPGTWYHALCRMNATHFTVFINGVENNRYVIPVSQRTTVRSTSGAIVIGSRQQFSTYFNGSIDDVRIYNKSLSAAQIKFLYDGRPSMPALAPGYYNASMSYTNYTGVAYTSKTALTNLSMGSVNIRVYDETTGAGITGINVTVNAVQNDTIMRWTNTSETAYVRVLPVGLWTFIFTAPGYAQRTYTTTVNSVTPLNLNAYLTQNTTSVTFSVTNKYTGDPLENALTTVYRYILGTWQVVESKYTDVTGRIAFTYTPMAQYRFLFTKAGYENSLFDLNPILFTEYDILLTPSVVVNVSEDYDLISLTYGSTHFYNGVTRPFSFYIAMPSGGLEAYGFNISYPGGWKNHSGTSASGETLTRNISIVGATASDLVRISYYYQTSAAGRRDFTVFYPIVLATTDGTFITGTKDVTYGLGLFERLLVAVIGALCIAGIATFIGRPLPGLALALVFLGYLVYILFIPIWSVLISFFVGFLIISTKEEF